MKKFDFTLQRILNFREQLLQKEKNSLSQLNLIMRQLEEEIAALRRETQELDISFREKAKKGVGREEISSHGFKIECGKRRQEELLKKLDRAKYDVFLQTGVVVKASQEVKKLEKLRDKQQSEYKYEETKAETEVIAEQLVIKLYHDRKT